MADSRRHGAVPQLDIEQILVEAQNRWLRPAEICEILRNYQKFRIAPEPPNKPRSGSLFLFDRKVLRYFRKDGHNWRKKKDGKTVKEAHERLKAESVDVLHCYYAHGEENENFQRRSYWLLDEDLMHIVLVHYLEVKGNRSNFNRSRDAEEPVQSAHITTPTSSSSFTNQNPSPSRAMDAESPISAQTSEYEDAESDNCQASSRYHPFPALQQHDDGHVRDAHPLNPYTPVPSLGNHESFQGAAPESEFYSVAQEDITKVLDESGIGFTFTGPRTQFDLASWEDVFKHSTAGFENTFFQPMAGTEADIGGGVANLEASPLMELLMDDLTTSQVDGNNTQGKAIWQFPESGAGPSGTSRSDDLMNGLYREGNIDLPSLIKQRSLGLSNPEEGLKKYDSFSKWMSKELGEVVDAQLNSNSDVYWDSVESGGVLEDPSKQEQLDACLISPSLSQDQLFSIIDFSPNWSYGDKETEVLITGKFLRSRDEVENCKWSCMFGEVEVLASVISFDILRCHAPKHKSGRVPFYVTVSNRLACSEVREFEFRVNRDRAMGASDPYNSSVDGINLQRFERMLCLESVKPSELFDNSGGMPYSSSVIGWPPVEVSDDLNWANNKELYSESLRDVLIQEPLKEKLYAWLLCKVAEGGKGPCVLDKEGLGVLHLAAALGYDWAIEPITNAGVNINFRDVHGWTALHWAAFCGRERMVVSLVALGAAPGLLTDPTPEFPSGRTPADLASVNGHKGISGFLAEASLTSQLSTLTLKDSSGVNAGDVSDVKAVEDVGEKNALQISYEDMPDGLSMKDSLSAVRNAAQAAARIHQVYRVHSFQRKKLIECGDDKRGLSNERALSFISVKSVKTGQHDMPVHVAAIRIQNKFRGWKGRREFLITRQRIVKIQAHVRGHQVRKHYRRIVWSVGIVEKVILRWRRKGSGLRGFRPEGQIVGPSVQAQEANDDYDFRQDGRKQTEARLEKALARVRSMVQYPEARDQYRRLMTIVTELQDSKVMQDDVNESDATDGDFMTGLEELCDDDTLIPYA
ncbi:calmodulin-binding transcription activator 1-like isoform X2 [Dioscorea cayenensis subsp. rotundata]|uniref:Calmodulin-binding transcription activator 1-like isoform X2 n=1 Tax=Dioscorea cayennensis subsp. rotundata TaxID=55577 RepID=A0AB40BFM3_DIOCR|nr:calmodulin-binding transcription activator 1-like isoform X2 [Dioscorea cayenensis subsp. rotundata]